MQRSLVTATVVCSALLAGATARNVQDRANDYTPVCGQIQSAISSASALSWPGEISYTQGIEHWASSSTQQSACSVQPGTAEDVGVILQILGNTNTPFAVKGGGHASNPGFSSTEGVHISMARFKNVTYDENANTVDVGSGLIWDDVYSALEPYAVNVVGGRVSGVGVAGFTLGGGYSWKTSQYGLTLDSVSGVEVVLPNGTVTTATADSNADLLWGIKGGYNNFGIVTKFTFVTHPQTEVWGGMITFTQDQLEAFNNATVKFAQNVTDPKAAVLPTYNYVLGEPGATLLLFYDNPTAPDGIFDDYLAISSFSSDVKTRSFMDLVLVSPSNFTAGSRAIFHTLSLLEYTPKIMDAVLNETKFWGEKLSLDSGTFISYDVEPFLSTIFSHAPEGSSAYPVSRAQGYLPLNIYYGYTFESTDQTFWDAAKASIAQLTAVIESEGQDIGNAPLYGNYAMFDTDVSRIFGDNLSKMQEVKNVYDPQNVMGLAGGWKC